MKKNAISFVIPCYNCAKTVEEAVTSIVDSNYASGDVLLLAEIPA